jgi:hypothetical protein
MLWTIHLFRRLMECVFITNYGQSEMHVFGFLVGLLHYTLVPLSFFCINCKYDSSTSIFKCFHVLAYVAYALGSVAQCQSHYVLYKLKTEFAEQ